MAADLKKLSDEIDGDFSASSENRRINTAVGLIIKALAEQNEKTDAIEKKQTEMATRVEKLIETVRSIECRLTNFNQNSVKTTNKRLSKDAVEGNQNKPTPSVRNLQQTVEEQQVVLSRIMSGSLLVVDACGTGIFSSIPPALEVARPGDTVIVRPGEYNDPLMLTTSGITIQGVDKSSVIIKHSQTTSPRESQTGSAMISFHSNCSVKNITIIATQPQCCGVRFEKGEGTISDCDISSHNLSCVVVSSGDSPLISGCEIHHSKQHGISCKSGSSPVIKNNNIHSNKQPNIAVDKESAPLIEGNKIHSSDQNGVWFRNSAMGKLIDNEIFSNAYSNVDINSGGEPLVQKNRIHSSEKCGICIAEGAGGDIQLNDIFGNAYSNIGIMARSFPTVKKNTIHASKQHGILVKSGAGGTVLDNDLYNNALANIKLEQGATTSVSNSR